MYVYYGFLNNRESEKVTSWALDYNKHIGCPHVETASFPWKYFYKYSM
jgi:hypothetical protein